MIKDNKVSCEESRRKSCFSPMWCFQVLVAVFKWSVAGNIKWKTVLKIDFYFELMRLKIFFDIRFTHSFQNSFTIQLNRRVQIFNTTKADSVQKDISDTKVLQANWNWKIEA